MGFIYTMTEAMEFLDEIIRDKERYNVDRHLNNRIYAKECAKCIEMVEGIELLADLLPVKLDVADSMSYFYYKDYLVYQVKEREKDD